MRQNRRLLSKESLMNLRYLVITNHTMPLGKKMLERDDMTLGAGPFAPGRSQDGPPVRHLAVRAARVGSPQLVG